MLNQLLSICQRPFSLLFLLNLLLGGVGFAKAQQVKPSAQSQSSTPVLKQEQGQEEEDEVEQRSMRRTYRKERTIVNSRVRITPNRKPLQREQSTDNSAAKSVANSNQSNTGTSDDSYLGFTLWQMKESSGGSEQRKLIKRKGNKDVSLRPVRIRTDSPLIAGEAYLFSIESTKSGYLYVIDQEEYADGKLGEPALIFPDGDPDTRDNKVETGRVIEIPKQKSGDYFQAERSGSNHVGELLTIIVTPQPLFERSQIANGSYSRELTGVLKTIQEKWGPNLNVKWTESTEEIGKFYSDQEGKAGSDPNSRLTEQDPLPQRLYRIKAKPEASLLVSLPLRYSPDK
jgi:hypothetical protein